MEMKIVKIISKIISKIITSIMWIGLSPIPKQRSIIFKKMTYKLKTRIEKRANKTDSQV